MKFTHIKRVVKYRPGDPEPSGYIEWHDWARVQYAAGIRQQRCRMCRRWYFPAQLDGHKCEATR